MSNIFFLLVVNEHVSLVISRQILTDVSIRLTQLPDDVSKSVSHYALDKVQPRVISFEEQVNLQTKGLLFIIAFS